METVKFKTNIKCSGCVAKVTPYLNQTAGEGNWEVDTDHPDKTLTVIKNGLQDHEIVKAVNEAGYNAEEIK